MGDYKVPERAEVTFVAVRHETGDELEALGEGCRVAVAEELRRIADERMARIQEERTVCNVSPSSCNVCAALEKAASEFVAPLASTDGPSDEVYVAVRQEAADRLPYGAEFAEAAGLTDEYRRGEQ